MTRRLLLIPLLWAAVPLAGCGPLLAGLGGPSATAPASGGAPAAPVVAKAAPGLLIQVSKRYDDALQAYDLALTAVDGLVASKVVTKGSPTAIKLHDAILAVKFALQGAGKLQRAAEATSNATDVDGFAAAMDDVSAAAKDADAAIAAAKGGK